MPAVGFLIALVFATFTWRGGHVSIHQPIWGPSASLPGNGDARLSEGVQCPARDWE